MKNGGGIAGQSLLFLLQTARLTSRRIGPTHRAARALTNAMKNGTFTDEQPMKKEGKHEQILVE